MERKNFFVWLSIVFLCLAFVTPCFSQNVNAMTILETDVKTASDGCTMLGVYGSYYSQAQEALDRINEIRREACEEGNVPDPRNPKRMLTMDDYVQLKWSTQLESVARIRAMEAGLAFTFMGSGHNRLNGKGVFSVQYNGIGSCAEDLAYNWGTSMVSGINQWYAEKEDWVNRVSGTVTGHYTSMINPDYTYVGLGDFYTEESHYPNTLAGQFSGTSLNLDQTMQNSQADVMQKIEVKNSFIDCYVLESLDTVYTDQTTKVTPKVIIKNGMQTHKLWVLSDVRYVSSNDGIATVNEEGVVTGVKNGTAIITAKTGDVVLSSKVITVKCNHSKELRSEIKPTCISTGLKIYSCDICGKKIEQETAMISHDYLYSEFDSQGYRTGVCSYCGDTIKVIPPTNMMLWWRNSTSESDYYYSVFPSVNPIGSIIYCWPDQVDGDKKYRDIIIESTDESVISVPETINANLSTNRLNVLASGITTITVYPKYNPTLKKSVVARIGAPGSVDIAVADVRLSMKYLGDNKVVQKPVVTVSYHDTVLKQGTDYYLEYEENAEQGIGTVVITGTGIFAGKIYKNYPITHTEHVAVIDEEVKATCTQDGLTQGLHCSVCGEIMVAQTIVKSSGHIWNETYTIDVPATETTEGSKSIHCLQCSETKDHMVIPVIRNDNGFAENNGSENENETTEEDSGTGNQNNATDNSNGGVQNSKPDTGDVGNENDASDNGNGGIPNGKPDIGDAGNENNATDNINGGVPNGKPDTGDAGNENDASDNGNGGMQNGKPDTGDAENENGIIDNSNGGSQNNTNDDGNQNSENDDCNDEDDDYNWEYDEDDDSDEDEMLTEVGDQFEVNGIIYEVLKMDWRRDKFEISCVGTESKHIKQADIPSYVEYDEITYKVISVGNKAFFGCKKLITVSLGNEITQIGNQAFYNCVQLEKMIIPSKVSMIGKSAFQKCKKLKDITIKTSKLNSKKIGKNAFKGIKSDSTIKVPKKKYKDYKGILKKKGIGKKAQYKKI